MKTKGCSVNIFRFIVVGIFVFPLATMAADKDAEKSIEVESSAIQKPQSVWTSDAELGFVKTTGNTTTEALHLKLAIDNQREEWLHSFKLESAKNSDSLGVTAKRYLIAIKSQYDLTQFSYLFGKIQYQDDRFSGYKYQASEVVGYGQKLINRDSFKLNAEAGMGVRQNKFDSGISETEIVFLLASDFDWRISKTASLTEDITVEVGEERTISKSVTALKTQINNSLSSKISYTIRTASEVPVGTEKTDTELAVTLVYTFK